MAKQLKEILETLSQGATKSHYFKPQDIQVEPGFNTRTDWGSLDELTTSIAQVGLKRPLLVRIDKDTEKVILVDGERRLKAILKGMTSKQLPEDFLVRCEIESAKQDTSLRVLDVVVTNSGKALTTYEEAEVYAKAMDEPHNLTVDQIAQATGKNKSWLKEILFISNADKALVSKARASGMSGTAFIELLKKNKFSTAETSQAIDSLAQAQQEAGKETGKKEKITVAKAIGKPTFKQKVSEMRLEMAVTERTAKYSEADILELLNYLEGLSEAWHGYEGK